jgi:hypothetical protein
MTESLLFMPDYEADPIWSLDDGMMIPLEHLPLSKSARRAAREWARRWDALGFATLEDDDEDTPEWRELEHAGRAVWQRLREELGSEYRLGYVTFDDGGKRQVQWAPDGPVEPCPPMAG